MPREVRASIIRAWHSIGAWQQLQNRFISLSGQRTIHSYWAAFSWDKGRKSSFNINTTFFEDFLSSELSLFLKQGIKHGEALLSPFDKWGD